MIHTPSETPSEGASLENRANNSATAGQGHDHDHSADRWDVRRVLWGYSSLKRVALCQRYPIDAVAGVQVRERGGVVGFHGLTSCGSVWCCPPCNARVQAHRRLEVSLGLAHALASGSSVAFGAYTIRHHQHDRLDRLWPALSKVWNAVAVDRGVREARGDLGHVGVLRAAEVTHGANGWHPHLHPAHVFGREVSPGDVAQLHREQFRAWSAAADRLGLMAPLSVAQDLHLVVGDDAPDALGDYFAKGVYVPSRSVGWEMTSTQTKSRTRDAGSRTPWDVLRSISETGDMDDLDLWHEWERASKNKRALTWSRGLRTYLGLGQEETDEDLVARSVGGREDTGLIVTTWGPIRATPRLGGQLLTTVRTQGWAAARTFCDEHGISYRDPDPTGRTHEHLAPVRQSLGLPGLADLPR